MKTTTAIDVIKQLDGLAIEDAQALLVEVGRLLLSTQVVSAESPLMPSMPRLLHNANLQQFGADEPHSQIR
jgi:hypothetical protein